MSTKIKTSDGWKEVAGGSIDTPNAYVTGTLIAGETDITLTHADVSSDSSFIDIYTSVPNLSYSDISVSGNAVTITFPAQSTDITVGMKVINI